MFGNHGLCGLLEEGAHGKSPKCLGGNLGDFGEFCKGLDLMLFFVIWKRTKRVGDVFQLKSKIMKQILSRLRKKLNFRNKCLLC